MNLYSLLASPCFCVQMLGLTAVIRIASVCVIPFQRHVIYM